MKKIKQIGIQFLILLIMGCTHSLAQENHEHNQGVSMQDLDAHLERISQSENTDISTRIQMLRHHMQMMREQLQNMQGMGHGGMMGGMNQGDGEGGMGRGGMMGGMNQGDGEGGMGCCGMMGGMNQGEAGMGGRMNQDQNGENRAMGESPHEDRGDCAMCHNAGDGGMNQGDSGMGGDMAGGMMGGMMQHHNNMVKMMEHILATQELLLQLIEE